MIFEANAEHDDQRVGIEIVRKAAHMPLRQIAGIADEDGAGISGKVLDRDGYNWGFDAHTGEFNDMVKPSLLTSPGLCDPRCSTQRQLVR